ncbi:MAG: hypothetical protein DCC49_12915 [Acidobacteria bacterium]|nr:MAG: hypothetical protein DCC49_12915 [Acidobacteriota bacterium]
MVTMKVTESGQVSIPAEVRRRWGAKRVMIVDEGERLILQPVPDDPIEAARGSLAGPGPTSEEMRARLRAEETEAEEPRSHR